MSAPDAYHVLGITPDATPSQVRQAYHRAVRHTRCRRTLCSCEALTRAAGQVLRVHPDRAGDKADATSFEQVQNAWESLRARRSTHAADVSSRARAR